MFNPFKRKTEETEDPPDELKGEVEFCEPDVPADIFKQEKSLDNFIKKISKNNNE